MTDPDVWARLLAGAGEERRSQPERICDLCVELLSVAGAGISMVTESGNRGMVCATDDVAARIEDLQFSLGEGPCVDAVQSGGPVLISDLARPDSVDVARWPAFMAAAAEAGIRGVFAFPLSIGAIRVGALDLYRLTPGELTDDELTGALLAADAAALALLHLGDGTADGFVDDLRSRAGYHLDVHQATGMVQAQLDVSTEEAFLRLRARAFADDRALTEVAADVINRRLRFDVEET